jgi:hypothetical protein
MGRCQEGWQQRRGCRPTARTPPLPRRCLQHTLAAEPRLCSPAAPRASTGRGAACRCGLGWSPVRPAVQGLRWVLALQGLRRGRAARGLRSGLAGDQRTPPRSGSPGQRHRVQEQCRRRRRRRRRRARPNQGTQP